MGRCNDLNGVAVGGGRMCRGTGKNKVDVEQAVLMMQCVMDVITPIANIFGPDPAALFACWWVANRLGRPGTRGCWEGWE